MKLSLDEMRLAIENVHGCDVARLVEKKSVPRPDARAATEVHLFEVEGHPKASRCYAWGMEISEAKIAIIAILESANIDSHERALLTKRPTNYAIVRHFI